MLISHLFWPCAVCASLAVVDERPSMARARPMIALEVRWRLEMAAAPVSQPAAARNFVKAKVARITEEEEHNPILRIEASDRGLSIEENLRRLGGLPLLFQQDLRCAPREHRVRGNARAAAVRSGAGDIRGFEPRLTSRARPVHALSRGRNTRRAPAVSLPAGEQGSSKPPRWPALLTRVYSIDARACRPRRTW